jgi:NADPH-dependent F420 reductase
MTVAIIGSGNVGSALGRRLMAAGVPVVFGVRSPSDAKNREALSGARVTTVADAASAAEVVILALPANAIVAAAKGAGDLGGKVVIDCANPLRFDRGPVWTPPAEGSTTQALAAALPGVAVVKGFNHFGAEIHADPQVAGGPADAFFAGDDDRAKRVAMALAERIGFRPIDAGPLRNAGLLENLAVLWIHLAMKGGRHFAFRTAGREQAGQAGA